MYILQDRKEEIPLSFLLAAYLRPRIIHHPVDHYKIHFQDYLIELYLILRFRKSL